jgi:hypothetical protein
MLTIQIDDTQTEGMLVLKAKASDKSVGQVVRELVAEQFSDPEPDALVYPRLDVREHARSYEPVLTEEENELLGQVPDVKLFSHVTDTTEFARQLRENSWKRK